MVPNDKDWTRSLRLLEMDYCLHAPMLWDNLPAKDAFRDIS